MEAKSSKSEEGLHGGLDKNQSVVHNTHHNLSHSTVIVDSPLPEPIILREYDKIYPGLAERIITLAENEQKMRHQMDLANLELEKDVILTDAKTRMRESMYLLIVGVISFMLSILSLSIGANNTALIINSGVLLIITIMSLSKKLTIVYRNSGKDNNGSSESR